jgi:steroid 5-alpha reductase family enzyme
MTTALFLAVNLAIAMAMVLLLWRVAVAIRDVSFIDVVWAYGMVLLAWATALRLPSGPAGPMGWALLALVSLWGVRLGTHLLLRWRRLGRDPRYDRILGNAMEKRGWSFSTAALLLVFLLQGPLLWFACIAAQAGMIADAGAAPGPLALAGVALALAGIGFESIGDAQLEAFRKNPASHGKVLDTGLWRYTRHPNYFGDALAWWGIWLLAFAAGAGLWTIAAPLFLSWTLNRWSGVPILEKRLQKNRPGYADYVARTSGFIPWPPRR